MPSERRRTRWVAVRAAAAVVVAVAVGVARYHGIEVAVPKRLPVTHGGCYSPFNMARRRYQPTP